MYIHGHIYSHLFTSNKILHIIRYIFIYMYPYLQYRDFSHLQHFQIKLLYSYKTISCHLKFLRLRDFEIPINEWDLPFSFKYNQFQVFILYCINTRAVRDFNFDERWLETVLEGLIFFFVNFFLILKLF